MSYRVVSYGGLGTTASDCTTGEFFDETVGECLCNPGLVPAPLVGGGCVTPAKPLPAAGKGGRDPASCLLLGMDYSVQAQQCVPKCPAGQGRDIAGNCVSVAAWDVAHGITPAGGGAAAPTTMPEDAAKISKAAMPWIAGAAVGVIGLALLATFAKKKPAAGQPGYRQNRRRYRHAA